MRAVRWNITVLAWAAASLAALGPVSQAQDDSPALTACVRRLVGQLDSDRFEERERATRELFDMGLPVVAPLSAMREHASAEVRWRAKAVIDALTVGSLRRDLAEFAALSDERLDIEHGMWLIARILDPTVKREPIGKALDGLAVRVATKLGKGSPAKADPEKVVAALHEVLFSSEGFTGNVADRYHPDNSSIAKVLATKRGLPIVLSHLTIAVGRRLNVPIVGVPLSGTYIVKYHGSQAPVGYPRDDIFFDPFAGGRILRTAEELDQAFPGQDAASEPPLDARDTLQRMLRNLDAPLAERKDYDRLALVEEFAALLDAYSSSNLRPEP